MSQPQIRALRRLGARAALFVLAALAALGACSDSATEVEQHIPEPLPQRVQIGDTVAERIAGGNDAEPSTHSFVPQSAGWVALHVEAEAGRFSVTVTDSTAGRRLQSGWYPVEPPTVPYSTPPFEVESGHVYTVTVAGAGSDSASFRYVVFRVNTAPESAPASIAIGDVVERETLDSLADIDEFTFAGKRGDELIVYAQGLAAAGTPGRLLVSVTQPDTLPWKVTVTAMAADPDPESHTTHVFTLPVDGTYLLTVASDSGPWYDQQPPYVGAYRIEVARINRAPEEQPATISFADTVTGTIGRVGDIDEFHFVAEAADRFNVFFQAAPDSATHALRLELPDLPGGAAYAMDALSSDSALLTEKPSGSFTTATAGSYTLRVRGRSDGEGLDRGGYRLFVYRVDPNPEHMPVSTLTLGDTIADEIELPGDIDELPVVIPAPSLVNMEIWRGAPSATRAPTARLVNASGATVLARELDPNDQPESRSTTGPVLVPAGSYTLRVMDDWTRTRAYRGPWRVVLHPIDTLPEIRSATVVPGDTVEEPSEPIGDIDRYRMSVKRGEHYDVYFQAAVGMGLRVDTDTLPITPGFGVYAGPIEGHALMESPHTDRIDVQEDGEFIITVGPADVGPYRFVVTRYSAAVEHHSATVAMGDTVDDEELDIPGDVDEFTLAGSPGEEATILFAASPTTEGLVLQIFDLDSKEVLSEMRSYVARQGTGRFRLPSSGQIGVRLMQAPTIYDYGLVGPYSMYILPIDRAPESAAAAFTIGDIVDGEGIEFSGDVDEFTFTGAAGDRVRAFLDLPHGDWGGYMGLTLEVSPAGSESLLGSVSVTNPVPDFDIGTGVITLPASGSYTVRVHGTEERSGGSGVPTEYRFQVRREP